MSLSFLPDETILDIASWIQTPQSLHGLCLVNRRLYLILEPTLYQRDALYSQPYSLAITWAAKDGMITLLDKALHYGATIPTQAVVGRLMVNPKVSVLYGELSFRVLYDCKAHPLTLATRYGHELLVKSLLERGCTHLMHDPTDLSLLSLAVVGGHINLIKTFLDLGVRQDGTNSLPHSPIQLAALLGNEKTVGLLLSEFATDLDNVPKEKELQYAVETALKAGNSHVLSHLLNYGVNLNFRFHIFGDLKRNPYFPSPLGWAIEYGDIDQVESLLDNGADVDFRVWPNVALIAAVQKRKLAAVQVLAPKTNRVFSTKALSLAVHRQDRAIINILLSSGVKCDFEESDRPRPCGPNNDGCCFADVSEPKEFIPPLVQAVDLDDLDLVRLLVAHGADVNIGYHDLRSTRSRLNCGRVVQLAMDLKNHEIVKFLLKAGADIYLKHPVWQWHRCPPEKCSNRRARHLRITAGLRAAASKVVSR